ncbi:MAG: hypothetical protein ACOYN5_15210 [Bacteroidales bacterium]
MNYLFNFPETNRNKIATAVSYLFHPILLPSWCFLALAFLAPSYLIQLPVKMTWVLFGFILMLTAVFPVLIMLLMIRAKMISSLMLHSRFERNGPVLVTAVFFFIAYYLLDYFGFAAIYGYYLLCATSLSLITMMINPFLKISLHAIGHGANVAVFINLALMIEMPLYIVIGFILIAGITATSRLILRVHKPAEVYAGFLLGMLVMTLLFQLIL